MANPTADSQTALDERVIEDRGIERALEDREKAKGAKNEAANTFRTKDEAVKGKLEELDVAEDAPVRIGRFRVTKKALPGRNVAFETAPSSRLTITPDKDE